MTGTKQETKTKHPSNSVDTSPIAREQCRESARVQAPRERINAQSRSQPATGFADLSSRDFHHMRGFGRTQFRGLAAGECRVETGCRGHLRPGAAGETA